jgi:hypothetical protein
MPSAWANYQLTAEMAGRTACQSCQVMGGPRRPRAAKMQRAHNEGGNPKLINGVPGKAWQAARR